MSSRTAIFVALPLAGLVALGAYAYYSNRPRARCRAGRGPSGQGPLRPIRRRRVRGQVRLPASSSPSRLHRSRPRGCRTTSRRSARCARTSRWSCGPRSPAGSPRSGSPRAAAVHKGQLLIALDSSVYAAELQQARANLALAETNYKRTTDLEREKSVSANAKDQSLNSLRVGAGERRARRSAAREDPDPGAVRRASSASGRSASATT